MSQYLIVRHGSNRANQELRDRAPVAIVEARNRDAATLAAIGEGPGRLLASVEWCHVAPVPGPCVTDYANQHLEAIPLSRARITDRRAVEEADAMHRATA